MNNHSCNANVQEYGCAALWNLASNNNNQVAIAETGGVNRILSAVKNHSSNANVQQYGILALWSLAVNDNKHPMQMFNSVVVEHLGTWP